MKPSPPPLIGLAGGFFLVLFDVRVGGVDVFPDVVGWVLVAVMIARLEGRHPRLRGARMTAIAGAGFSLLDVYVPPDGTDSFVLGVIVPVGYRLVTAIALILSCTGLSASAKAARDEPGEFRFRSLAVLNGLLAIGALVFQGVLVSVLRDKPEGYVLSGPLQVTSLILGVLEFAVMIWLVVSLVNASARPWAAASVGTPEFPDRHMS